MPTIERSDASLRRECRIAGVFVLLTILAALVAQGYVSQRLVTSNATTTATNILEHRGLWQLAYAFYIIEMTCQIAATALLYDLLKPVGRNASLIAAWISLVGITIKMFARVFFIAPLVVLGGSGSFGAFGADELRALSLLLLELNDDGAGLALIFFGFATFVRGVLMFRSTFVPRFIGALGMLAGLLWTTFLYPPLASKLFVLTLAIGLIGSLVVIVWLLVKGVDGPRWRETARQAIA
jgi:uncharacterized protein DUF4386